MALKYKSEFESDKKNLAEVDNKGSCSFIASCQGYSHRLGDVKICRATFGNLSVSFCCTVMSCGALVQMACLSATEAHLNCSLTKGLSLFKEEIYSADTRRLCICHIRMS